MNHKFRKDKGIFAFAFPYLKEKFIKKKLTLYKTIANIAYII